AMNLYRAAFRVAFPDTLMVPDLQRVSDAQTGLFEPQASPAGNDLAATVFRADGYHIGIAPITGAQTRNADVIATVQPRAAAPITENQSPSTTYSPWRTLLPRYWIPYFESALESNSGRIGAFTSGEDVVGRHAYQALLFVPSDNSGLTGALYYRNATLGQPLVELGASQDWENYFRILDASQQNKPIG